MVFTSQGIPFFLGGEECARSKPIENSREVSDNSYNLSLYTNALRYERDEMKEQLLCYYKGLIAFRKAHKGLRLSTAEEVRTKLHFLENTPEKVVGFTLEEGTPRRGAASPGNHGNRHSGGHQLPCGYWVGLLM